jgi:hypothetical protein
VFELHVGEGCLELVLCIDKSNDEKFKNPSVSCPAILFFFFNFRTLFIYFKTRDTMYSSRVESVESPSACCDAPCVSLILGRIIQY